MEYREQRRRSFSDAFSSSGTEWTSIRLLCVSQMTPFFVAGQSRSILEQITRAVDSPVSRHPEMRSTDIGSPMLTYKVTSHQPLSTNRWGGMFDSYLKNNPPGDFPANWQPRFEMFDSSRAYGACNSRRMGYRGMPRAPSYKPWETIPDAGDTAHTFYAPSLFSSVPNLIDSAEQRSYCTLSSFGYFEDPFVTEDRKDDGEPLLEAGRVWQISVPVISESCEDLVVASCQGINGAINDPLIAANKAYQICGFIRISVIDTDVGQAPPSYPRNGCEDPGDSTFDASATHWQAWNHKELHYPWGFDLNALNADGPENPAPTSCNNIRTRTLL